jgi:hypothetical protein
MQKVFDFQQQTPRAEAERRFAADPSVCFQKHLTNVYEEIEGKLLVDVSTCSVEQISRERASRFIMKYEYLGHLGVSMYTYGLVHDGDLVGVASFGNGSGVHADNVCDGFREKTIGLQRGSCRGGIKNSASYLISRACSLMHKDHGWLVFYAYADEDAGEIGNVYQACNWIYIGQSPGRGNNAVRYDIFRPDDGLKISERTFVDEGLSKAEAIAKGWVFKARPGKHKFIHFEGDRRTQKQLKRALRYPILPYPKRRS